MDEQKISNVETKYDLIHKEIVQNLNTPIPKVLGNLRKKTLDRINNAEDRCDNCEIDGNTRYPYKCDKCRLYYNVKNNFNLLELIDDFENEFGNEF